MSVMDNVEIQSILPHRYPFCSSIASVSSIRTVGSWGSKTSRLTSRFSGHFPGRPVMPGCADPRALAPGGRRLRSNRSVRGPSGGLSHRNRRGKFRKPVVPGISSGWRWMC